MAAARSPKSRRCGPGAACRGSCARSRPGRAWAFGDGSRPRPVGIADRPVDHEMGDVNALRRELPCHALGQTAQSELAHREWRRVLVALHARRGPGEEDGASTLREHATGSLLCHQEGAERRHLQASRDRRRDRGPPAARACGRSRCRPRSREIPLAAARASSNSAATCSGSAASQATAAAPVASSKGWSLPMSRAARTTRIPSTGKQASKRGAQATARADDQSRPVCVHAAHSPSAMPSRRGSTPLDQLALADRYRVQTAVERLDLDLLTARRQRRLKARSIRASLQFRRAIAAEHMAERDRALRLMPQSSTPTRAWAT